MKRLSELAKQRQLRLQQKRKKRTRKTRAFRKFLRIHRTPGERFEIIIPETIDFVSAYEDTATLIQQIRESVFNEGRQVFLNFENCKTVSSNAALVLAAEVERCRLLKTWYNKPTLTGNYPHDKSVDVFLTELGFFRLLRLAERFERVDVEKSERFIKMRSGTRVKGELVEGLQEVAFAEVVDLENSARFNLYRALTEAMQNVNIHAYDVQFDQPFPVLWGRWWMAGYWNKPNREIRAIFYDQGVTIPATMPIRHESALAKMQARLGMGASDGELIASAMELGATRTGKPQHGNGMADLRRFIDKTADGHLQIWSRGGEYLYDKVSGEGSIGAEAGDTGLPGQFSNHRVPLGGTLIEWRISDHNVIEWTDDD